MTLSPPPADPRRFIREFRAGAINFHNLWTRVSPPPPPGVELRTPAERPITTSDVPEGARALLADYLRHQPGVRVEFVKYLRAVDGQVVEVVEDERDLPGEDELIALSRTMTLATATTLRLVTEIVVGRVFRQGDEAA